MGGVHFIRTSVAALSFRVCFQLCLRWDVNIGRSLHTCKQCLCLHESGAIRSSLVLLSMMRWGQRQADGDSAYSDRVRTSPRADWLGVSPLGVTATSVLPIHPPPHCCCSTARTRGLTSEYTALLAVALRVFGA